MRTNPRRDALVCGSLLLALALGGCGSASSEGPTLTVYAASSLHGVFTELGEQFEDDHPGVTVSFSFGGSSDLAAQIQQGAPADVFAAADTTTMGRITADGLADEGPENFASNTLEIVTPPDNPAKVAGIADLALPGLDLVLCAAPVPCGRAARTVAAAAGVTLRPASEEQSVKDVVAKVAAGEADAGLVYVTDVLAAGDTVLGIPFPDAAAAVNRYPIATLDGSDREDLAAEFLALVLSNRGQRVLAAAGFGAP